MPLLQYTTSYLRACGADDVDGFGSLGWPVGAGAVSLGAGGAECRLAIVDACDIIDSFDFDSGIGGIARFRGGRGLPYPTSGLKIPADEGADEVGESLSAAVIGLAPTEGNTITVECVRG